MTALALLAAAALSAQVQLDYEYFRDRVQPIFLKQRPGHARCIACHPHRVPPLQPLPPSGRWSEEDSRKNFNAWKAFTVPGNPLKSPILLHPLAESAGGDRFHAGGKHWKSQSDAEWQTIAAWIKGAKLAPQKVVRVLQSNAAGDNIHVIDPATNQVVDTIEGIEVPHGLVISPDGTRIYVTNEARVTLDIVETRSFQVSKRIPLSGRPNNVDVSKDGRFVYVGIVDAPGAVDVIDIQAGKNIKSVPTKGGIHNVYLTPDGKFVVAGSIPGKTINVIDAKTNEPAWTLAMDAGIRPMVFTTNPDGSTKEIVTQLSDFHGFALVDFKTRKEVRRITMPDPPGKHKETQGLQGSPAHGLAISPDGKVLWSTSKWYDYVAVYSLPELKLIKVIEVGHHPEWVTIPPDGKNVYIAIAGHDATAVVDSKTMKLIKTIPVGAVPKRVTSGVLTY